MSWPGGIDQVASCSPDLHHLTPTPVRRMHGLSQAYHVAALGLMAMGLLRPLRNW